MNREEVFHEVDAWNDTRFPWGSAAHDVWASVNFYGDRGFRIVYQNGLDVVHEIYDLPAAREFRLRVEGLNPDESKALFAATVDALDMRGAA